MAVVNTKSTIITNLDASPPEMADARHAGSRNRVKSASVAVAAGDDDGSTYRFVRVRSSDSLKSIKCINTAITGGNDYDCGLYRTAEDGGAVVDADLYADGFALALAAPAVPPTADGGSPIELRFGDASTAVPGDVNNRVWEDLGLTEDPGLDYDLVLTANTVGTGAGTIALVVEYTDGS